MIENLASELISIVDTTALKLSSLDVELVRTRPAPGKWSIQEITGHLLDSAVNNHHRFVRAQQAEVLAFPDYEQESWVKAQGYNGCDWTELVELWRLYNRHLARVMRLIPREKRSVECRIGSYEPVTLGFLLQDYLVHLKHHLKQIEDLRSHLGSARD